MKQTLWTIQSEEAYRVFEKTGLLRADGEHLGLGPEFAPAYGWMAAQMRARIGQAPEGVVYPVWAWYQWEGRRRRRDLRLSGYAKRGTPMVQITFEAEPKDFLLSDFDGWHFVLNNHFLADSEAQWDAFYQRGGGQAEITASWDKVFDLERYAPDWGLEPDQRSVQATLWQIPMSWVRKVEHFIAK